MTTPDQTSTRASYGRRLAGVGAALALPAALLAAGMWVPAPPSPTPTPMTEVHATPNAVLLTCLDAMVDPFNAQRSHQLTPLILPAKQATGDAIRLEWSQETDKGVHGSTIVAQSGGDLRGLSLLPCVQPRPHHWFAAGSTTAGEDTLIRVTNPSATEAVVTMRMWGTHGPIPTDHDVVTIPAGASTTLRPGISAANQERIAVSLETNGPAIGAWMLSSGMDGEVPQGTGWVSAADSAQEHTITGFTTGEATLRVLNPSESPTRITVQWMADGKRQPLPGATLELAGGTVTDIPLPRISQGYATAIVHSQTHPVIAQAMVTRSGEQWPQGKKQWAARSLLTPAMAVTEAVLPPKDALTSAVAEEARKTPLRATSIATKNGLTIEAAHVLITNTSNQPATVQLTDTDTTTVPANSHATVELPQSNSASDTALKLTSDQPIHIAIAVTAHTPTGKLDAIYPVTIPNLAHAAVPVLSR